MLVENVGSPFGGSYSYIDSIFYLWSYDEYLADFRETVPQRTYRQCAIIYLIK